MDRDELIGEIRAIKDSMSWSWDILAEIIAIQSEEAGDESLQVLNGESLRGQCKKGRKTAVSLLERYLRLLQADDRVQSKMGGVPLYVPAEDVLDKSLRKDLEGLSKQVTRMALVQVDSIE